MIRKIQSIWIMILVLLGTTLSYGQNADLKLAQNELISYKKLGVSVNSKIRLSQALERLEKKFDVSFIYKTDLLDGIDVPSNIGLSDNFGRELLKLLEPLNLKYARINNRTFAISIDFSKYAATNNMQHQVEGTVTDAETGQALPGVNISVKNTTTGTTTNSEGRYEINVPSLSDTLIYSFIGYQTQEVLINGRTTIDVALESVVVLGEELVVTAFGLEREQRSLSYSTQGVETEHLSKARELNVLTSLSGRVAGMTMSQAGTGVGASARVVLRGNRSISGDSQPLYVVDGVPIAGAPEDLNSDNIASIDVLKGPNAAALYGSRAQNGVIMIETQTGQRGEVNYSISNTFQLSQPIYYMDFQNEFAQGAGGVYLRTEESAWGPRMEGQMVEHWSLDPADAGKMYALEPQGNRARHDVFQTGYNNSSNININMGTERSRTVFNYTYTDAEGILPGNELQRHNVSVRVNNQLTDRLHLDSKLEFMKRSIDNSFAQGNSNFNPVRQVDMTPPNIRSEDLQNFEYTDESGLNRQNYWSAETLSGSNPYWMLYRNLKEATRAQVIALTSFTYDISAPLSLRAQVSYDGSFDSNTEKNWFDTFTRAENGEYTAGKGEVGLFHADALLTYTTDLSPDWSIDVNLGTSIEDRRTQSSLSANTGEALLVPNFFAMSNTSLPGTSFNPGAQIQTQSVYAFSQIGWRDAVYLNLTGRNDWSSTLPAGNRSYFYPSVGLSTILSDLIPNFPEWLTFAKVRASFAEVGSSAPAFLGSRTASFSAGGNGGFIELDNTLPKPDLRPERTQAWEAGLDIRFFDGRLGLDLTAYQTNTFNQLFTIALPVGSGASSFFTNGGDVENRGIEALLSTIPIQTTNLRWDFDIQFSKNRNMVNEINDERPRVVLDAGDRFMREFVVEEGHPYGEIYSRGFLRDDDGNVIVSESGVPQVTTGRSVRVGNFSPDWQGAISSEFTYRSISFSFLIEHKQGGQMTSHATAILAGNGLWAPTAEGRDGGLVFGDNFFSHETAVMPDGSVNDVAINAETFWTTVGGRVTPVGEIFTEDATNTRLREVTIGYNLPESILATLPVSNVQISLVGRDLFFIYKAADSMAPDILVGTGPTSEGFQSFAPPTTRSVGANIKINF